ncbi:multidrug efflux pump subunit AcrB [Bradyrhizobium yuanmingense]
MPKWLSRLPFPWFDPRATCAGIAELNGKGEVASGIVLQRFGVNAPDVIENVRQRFREIASSLPKSVEIVPVYDRSGLIYAAIDTLKHNLFEESIVVAPVCIVFLLHVRSALVAILMLPVGVLMAFGAMKLLGLASNIMSLGGIAIAIGAMVDAAIVMIENAHKHLERAEPGQSRVQILIDAASEVGSALFSACSSSPSRSSRFSRWNRKRGGCSARWRSPRPSRWRPRPAVRHASAAVDRFDLRKRKTRDSYILEIVI